MTKNYLKKVIDGDLCAGCGLCSSIFNNEKITINLDRHGYCRPIIKDNDIYNFIDKKSQKIFKQVCPGYSINYSLLAKESEGGNDPVWGKSLETFIGYSSNEKIRYLGSSGGVITSILCYLLKKKLVDGVIHVGTKSNEPLKNQTFLSTTVEEVINRSGSRYSPSSPLNHLEEMLKKPLTYAFVGKPCDVAALVSYAQVDQRIEKKIKYKIAFFCAGVPSSKGTDEILESFRVKKDEVAKFKYRGEGWPGYTTVTTKNGTIHKMTYNDSWGRILNRYLQKRCKVCIDGIGEFADISCGDAWESDEKGYPIFSEGKGRNIIIVRNKNGKQLMDKLLRDGYINRVSDVDNSYLENIQPYQANRRKQLLSRVTALRLLMKSAPKYNIGVMIKSACQNSIKNNIRGFTGSILRIWKGRM